MALAEPRLDGRPRLVEVARVPRDLRSPRSNDARAAATFRPSRNVRARGAAATRPRGVSAPAASPRLRLPPRLVPAAPAAPPRPVPARHPRRRRDPSPRSGGARGAAATRPRGTRPNFAEPRRPRVRRNTRPLEGMLRNGSPPGVATRNSSRFISDCTSLTRSSTASSAALSSLDAAKTKFSTSSEMTLRSVLNFLTAASCASRFAKRRFAIFGNSVRIGFVGSRWNDSAATSSSSFSCVGTSGPIVARAGGLPLCAPSLGSASPRARRAGCARSRRRGAAALRLGASLLAAGGRGPGVREG